MNTAIQAYPQHRTLIEPTYDRRSSAFPAHRVLVQGHQTAWGKQLEEKLQELVSLPSGWDGYTGKAVSFTKAAFAYDILNRIYLEHISIPSLVPGSDGSLQAEWHSNGFDIEIDIMDVNHVFASMTNHHNGHQEELEIRTNFTVVWQWLKDMAANEEMLQIA